MKTNQPPEKKGAVHKPGGLDRSFSLRSETDLLRHVPQGVEVRFSPVLLPPCMYAKVERDSFSLNKIDTFNLHLIPDKVTRKTKAPADDHHTHI